MKHLLSKQSEFLQSFKGTSDFENLIKVNGTTPKDRLAVYHNNIIQSLIKCLKLVYPLTWELIGEDCANGAAYNFVDSTKSVPSSGDLVKWGKDFPDFLETYEYTKHLAYVPDFARLEWLKHISYSEEDKKALTSADFENLAPEQMVELRLKVHPTAFLFSSGQPLDQVMDVIEGSVENITLDQRGSCALIIRPSNKVHVHWISEDYYNLIQFIQSGCTLIEALEKLGVPEFPFPEFLLFSLKTGLFVGYELPR